MPCHQVNSSCAHLTIDGVAGEAAPAAAFFLGRRSVDQFTLSKSLYCWQSIDRRAGGGTYSYANDRLPKGSGGRHFQ